MSKFRFYLGWLSSLVLILASVLSANLIAAEVPLEEPAMVGNPATDNNVGSLTENFPRSEATPDTTDTLAASSSSAEDLTEETVSEDTPIETKKEIKSLWENFNPPRDDKYDWIQLSSGEWLKGELISLYSFTVEFDSDELGLLKIDWDDIKQIRSARPMSMRIEKDGDDHETTTVRGKLQLLDNTAVIVDGEKVSSYQRFQIISIAKGSDKESDLWVGKVSLGTNIKKGNSDTTDANFKANAQRRTANSRFVIDLVANFSETQNIETSNNQKLFSYYDSFLSRKFFWRTYSAEYQRDPFRNIDSQYSLGTAFGYDLIRNSKTEWEISGGVGALYKRFVSVSAGEDIDNVSPFLGIGTKFDTELTSWMDYLIDIKLRAVDEDSGSYTLYLLTTLSSDITGDLDLDISFVWDRIADPQPAADLTVPEKDDIQLIVSVSYEF